MSAGVIYAFGMHGRTAIEAGRALIGTGSINETTLIVTAGEVTGSWFTVLVRRAAIESDATYLRALIILAFGMCGTAAVEVRRALIGTGTVDLDTLQISTFAMRGIRHAVEIGGAAV